MSGKEKNKKSEKLSLRSYYYIPVFFIIAVIPLIVFGKYVKLTQVEIMNWKGKEYNLDMFSYYKSQLFVFFTFAEAFFLAANRVTGNIKLKKNYYYIALAALSVLTVLSAVLSEYRDIAFKGFIEQYQGMWVLLSYFILVAVVYNMANNEKDIKLMIKFSIFSASIISIIGASQFFGFDIFKTHFGRMIILPEYLHSIAETLNFSFGKYTIYSTLYNSNYAGSFAALFFPVSFALYTFGKRAKKVFYGIFSVLIFIMWLGSNSRAGYVGLIFGVLFMIMFFKRNILLRKKSTAVILMVYICVFISMNYVSGGTVTGEFARLNPGEDNIQKDRRIFIENLVMENGNIEFVTSDVSFTIHDSGNQYYFANDKGDKLKGIQDGNRVLLSGDEYEDFEFFFFPEENIITAKIEGEPVIFQKEGENYKYRIPSGKLYINEAPSRFKLFDGRERFASGRGYIWSRTLPLFKNTLLLGYGPDNYTLYFPQNDFAGKWNYMSSYHVIVDKPHNLYMQMGINTGVLSMVVFMLIYFLYFIRSIKVYRKRHFKKYTEFLGAGIFCGVISYLMAAMFNDQIISVAPYFYFFSGIGIALNEMNLNQN